MKLETEVLIEQQGKLNKRIHLRNLQRIRIAAIAKHLSQKMLEQCTELFKDIFSILVINREGMP